MQLKKVSGCCEGNDCPAVYETDRDTYLVQGKVISDQSVLTQLGMPAGETAVEIPRSIIAGVPAC